MNRWLNNARETISAYIDILEHWEKVYSPRSPIDPVSERFLESVHQKGYGHKRGAGKDRPHDI